MLSYDIHCLQMKIQSNFECVLNYVSFIYLSIYVFITDERYFFDQVSV